MITLSILIPTLESRRVQFQKLYDHLLRQFIPHMGLLSADANIDAAGAAGNDVEVLYYRDNKEKTTGEKRQWLLEHVKGEYIVFVDCDDWVPDYYVSEILKALETKPDCLGINGNMFTNNQDEVKWFLSKDNLNRTLFEDGKPYYVRATNHIAPVKKELALKAGFPSKSYGEDADYSIKLKPFLKTEVVVHPPLYTYFYSTFNKEYK